MENDVVITREDVKGMKLLSDEEIQKLDFHELCLYLNMLDNAERILEGSEE